MLKRIVAVLLTGVLLLLCGCVSTVPDNQLAVENGSYETMAPPEVTSTSAGTITTTQETTTAVAETTVTAIDPEGSYTTKEDVALYLYTYGELPPNFITKKEAQQLGWEGGSLEPYAPGCCIGGSYFGNYEGLLPKADDRSYYECDIDTLGASSRGAKRIVYSNDGLIYYTADHYESFELLYGDPDV